LPVKRLAVAVNAEILQGNNPGIPSFLCGRERYAFLLLREIKEIRPL
jgi:hypothetical protein